VVEKTENVQVELALFLHVICLQEIEPSPRLTKTKSGASPGSQSHVRYSVFKERDKRPLPSRKRRARNLAFWFLEVNDFLVGFIPCS